jgi:hypothetical protein
MQKNYGKVTPCGIFHTIYRRFILKLLTALLVVIGLVPAIAMAQAKSTLDVSKDGKVTKADMMAMDTNKDGKVTAAEAKAAGVSDADFKKADKNGDGIIDYAEWEKIYEPG